MVMNLCSRLFFKSSFVTYFFLEVCLKSRVSLCLIVQSKSGQRTDDNPLTLKLVFFFNSICKKRKFRVRWVEFLHLFYVFFYPYLQMLDAWPLFRQLEEWGRGVIMTCNILIVTYVHKAHVWGHRSICIKTC